MRYRIIETDNLGVVNTTVCIMNDDDSYTAFQLTDDNPNTAAYLAWLAEGNTPEPWQPET